MYQAANWLYVGKGLGRDGRPIERFLRPDGVVVSRRGLWPRRRDEVLEQGWRVLLTEAKHKYVWFEGSSARRRALRRACRYPFLPYPKRGATSEPSPASAAMFSPSDGRTRRYRTAVMHELHGRSMSLLQWCDVAGLPRKTVEKRMRTHGWTLSEALGTPIARGRSRTGSRRELSLADIEAAERD